MLFLYILLILSFFFFFFFQAEDGIRDLTVTGVQTCALPILFRALGGLPGVGGVADSLVVSDTSGYAETVATLGTVAGVQGFDARALAQIGRASCRERV